MSERNPPWQYDEILLALDLYLAERKVLEEHHPEVVRLSSFLRTLPLHPERGNANFRSPDAVVLKLANLRALDPTTASAGMDAGGRRTREIWERFGDNPEEVRRLASAIRSVGPLASCAGSVEEEGVLEGRLLVRRHREHVRDPRAARKRREAFIAANGRLFCEACGFEPTPYAERGGTVIECHHTQPLSQGGERHTRPADLVLLCANCHRAVHARTPWLSPEDLRTLLAREEPEKFAGGSGGSLDKARP